jgi:PAS domain S-box-containing protein
MDRELLAEDEGLWGRWPLSLCHVWLRRPAAAAAAALGLVAIAAAIRLGMGDAAPAPLLPFYPAIVIATFLGGRFAGYIATFLAWALAWYFFADPDQRFVLREGAALAMAVYVPTTVIVLEVVHALCNSAMRLIQTTNRLQLEAIEQAQQRSKLLGVIDELQAIYNEAPVGLGLLDADLRFTRVNDCLADMNGFSVEEHLGRSAWDLVPDLRASAEPILRRVVDHGEVVRDVEITGETAANPGVKRTWSEVFYPVHGPDGQRRGVGILCVEITDLKHAREREVLLTREVDHRAKNLLAVVQSIVQMMKAQGSIAEFKDALLGRIAAISRTHSHLAENRWDGVSLRALIVDELSPYAVTPRFENGASQAVLRSGAGQALGMVVHELATNSSKYGALSNDGHIDLICMIEGAADEVVVTWTESGGPPVTPPERQGFGTRLIERSVQHGLGGTLDYQYRPEGVYCKITIPRSALV